MCYVTPPGGQLLCRIKTRQRDWNPTTLSFVQWNSRSTRDTNERIFKKKSLLCWFAGPWHVELSQCILEHQASLPGPFRGGYLSPFTFLRLPILDSSPWLLSLTPFVLPTSDAGRGERSGVSRPLTKWEHLSSTLHFKAISVKYDLWLNCIITYCCCFLFY